MMDYILTPASLCQIVHLSLVAGGCGKVSFKMDKRKGKGGAEKAR